MTDGRRTTGELTMKAHITPAYVPPIKSRPEFLLLVLETFAANTGGCDQTVG